MAYKEGWRSSNIDGPTYIFLGQVLRQALEPPAHYPEKWGGKLADYGMDPEVVDDPAYKDDFAEAFRIFPTLSIAMDREDMFGRQGIYQNTGQDGPQWERPTSVEFIFPDDPNESFRVSCGIRIQGGSSRQDDIPKHAFSLRFREEYGLGELSYPLFRGTPFGETAVERFDFLQLRSGFNFAWTHRHYYQAKHAQYNRDQFVNDLYLAMGHPGTHGRWFHLYINGLYWGLYHVHERPDANYMATYFGGSKEDYDAVNSGRAADGNLQSWNAMWSLARKASDPDAYAQLQDHLHVEALIDYMLLNFYVGNWDWDGHNWRAAGRHGSDRGGGWYFFPWDSEFAIAPNGAGVINQPEGIENALTVDRTRVGGGNNRPTGLHQALLKNADYRRHFEDRVQRHFYNGGVFTPERTREIWKARSDLMDVAVMAESARWGDYKRDHVPGRWPAANYDLYTKNDHYLPSQRFILERYLPERTAIVLEQMRSSQLIGKATAPRFEVAGEPRHGGVMARGEVIQLRGSGILYYTLDGTSDPRDPLALPYEEPGILLQRSTTVRARSRFIFGGWSPLAEAFFSVGQPASETNLVVSEVHYHPAPLNAEERAAGHALRSEFEYVELMNVGAAPINLLGVAFVDGIAFEFAEDHILGSGQGVLLVSNREAFTRRYPTAASRVAGEYEGRLRNSGETLVLLDADGKAIQRILYDDDEPWPESADGEGYSLVLLDPGSRGDPADPANWAPSKEIGGSPGRGEDGAMPPTILDYAHWRVLAFSEDQLGRETVSGPLADADGDGRPTLVEYAAGSWPLKPDAESVLSLTVDASGVTLSWVQRRALSGVTFGLEASTDLRRWHPTSSLLRDRTEEIRDETTVRVSARLDLDDGSRYLRAKVRSP